MSPKSFEDVMQEALSKSGHIKYVRMNDVLDKINRELLIKLSTNSYNILIKEDTIAFLYENGVEFNCPGYGAYVSRFGEWLSEKLPDIPFDIECDGNVRKAEETTSG